MSMIAVSTLLTQLWEQWPSLIIVYDENTRKTLVIDGETIVSSADNIDQAILLAWTKKIYHKEVEYG